MADNTNDEVTIVEAKTVKGEQKKDKKQKKSKNWKSEETSWLVEQIGKRRNIIESKATNRGFKELNQKNAAWLDIAKGYNNKVGFTPRTVESIKAKWDNLKSDCKKKADALKKHLNQTGAAPDPKLGLTPLEEKVMDVMNVVKSSLENPFDNDSGCITISYSCEPATSSARSRSIEKDLESEDGDDAGTNSNAVELEIVEKDEDSSSKTQQKRRSEAQATPTPMKKRKVTKEEMDLAQMEVWELQKQQMIEKHQAYMDTLDLMRTLMQQGTLPPVLPAVQSSMGLLQHITDLDEM